jgi:hypothetical protein
LKIVLEWMTFQCTHTHLIPTNRAPCFFSEQIFALWWARNSEILLQIRKNCLKFRKIHQTLESTKLKEIHIIKKEKWKKPLIGKMKQSPLW